MKRALSIGINYPGTSNSLRGCVNDSRMIEILLRTRYGFEDITLLLDNDATTDNMRKALNKLVDSAEPGDVLFFHYSGHGSQVLNQKDDDDIEPDGLDEIICPVDLLVSSDAISMIISHHSENRNVVVTLAVDFQGNLGSVVSVDSLGRVMGVQREVDNADSTAKSAMFMVVSLDFTKHCQAALNSGSTRAVSVLNNIIEKGHIIQSHSVRERWFDVDTISDVLEANRSHLVSAKVQHRGSIFIPSGDIMEIGDTLDLGSGIKVGRGVSLNGPCLIQGNSKIGENSIIGPHASLDKGTEVGDNCEIQNAVILGLSKIPNRSKVSGIVMYESESFKMEE